jgi:hypothetical protein
MRYARHISRAGSPGEVFVEHDSHGVAKCVLIGVRYGGEGAVASVGNSAGRVGPALSASPKHGRKTLRIALNLSN